MTEAGLLEDAVRGVRFGERVRNHCADAFVRERLRDHRVRGGGWEPAPATGVIYVVVERRRLRTGEAAGADVTEPVELGYGSRDVTVTDPDGNRWTLGTYRGAAAAD